MLRLLCFSLLLDLEKQSAVDVWQDTTKGDGGLDQSIQLFVTSYGELEVARSDTFDLEILGGVLGVSLAAKLEIGSRGREGNTTLQSQIRANKNGTYACQFENFGGEILENSGDVNSSFSSDSHLILAVLLEEALDTTARELGALVSNMQSGEV